MTRIPYAHDAVVVLDSGGDARAPGGAITVALCGHWDHEPPCPLAPHHTDATPEGDDTLRVRVLFAAEPITDVDTTAAQLLADLDEELNADGVHLAFAGLKDPVKDTMVRYGLLETIDHTRFFPTLDVAVESFGHNRI